MEIGGFEVQVAKDPLFFPGVLRVHMVADASVEVGGHLGAAGAPLAAWTEAEVGPFEPHGRQLVLGHAEEGCEFGVRLRRGLIGRQGFDLQQGHLGVLGRARFGRGLSDLVDDLGKGTEHLQTLAAALELRRQVVATRLVKGQLLAVRAGVGAAFEAGMSGFELAIGGQNLALDQAEIDEQLHHNGRRLVNDGVAHAFAEVTEAILPGDGRVEAGQLPVAAALVGLLQVATEAGVVGVAIDGGRHLQKQEAGRVVAVAAPGAIGPSTQGAGEAEIQGGAD